MFELKNGKFKVSYLAQLSAYLRILNDEDRRSHEEAPLGLILCKDADEMDPEVLKALPPKEELIRLMQDNGTENLIKKS